MACQFDSTRYLKRINDISFSSHEGHTDRLCCFFDPNGEEKHPVDKSAGIILMAGIIETKDINRPLQDIVLETGSFKHEYSYHPCQKLEFSATIEEKEAKPGLVLSALCTIYDTNLNFLDDEWRWRIRRCKKYPGDEPCYYDKFSCSPAEQVAKTGKVYAYLFAIKKTGENDFLKEFSAGIMKMGIIRRYLAQWYLIPVPMKKECAQQVK